MAATPQSDCPHRSSDAAALLASARWALRLAWSTNARLLVAVAVVVLGRGLLPAVMAVTARGVVNASVAALSSALPSIAGVIPWLLLGLTVALLDGVSTLASKLFSQRLRDDLNYRVTGDILTHAAQLDMAYFEDPRSQDVLERAKQNPAEQVASFVTDALACVGNGLQIASLLGILIFIEPLILVVVLLFAAPYLWFQWHLALRQYAREYARTTKRRWSSYFVASLTEPASVGEVKILGLAPLLIEKFRSLMAEFRDQDRLLYVRSFRGGAVFVIVTTTAIYVMFLRVALRVVGGSLTLGDLAIFGGAATRLRSTLESLIGSLTAILQRTLHISNVTEFLAVQPQAITAAGRNVAAVRAEIVCRNVTFTYRGSKEPALRDLCLRIRAGETVAFVGENGAGKSTLVKLIARLYDPDEGSILLNGVDLRTLAYEAVRDQIAFVFQSFGRYEASAADNIAYGDWRRLLGDRQRIRAIAQLAGVDEMVSALPEGYDTLLGRSFGQTELSGGEWQKIAVARAFARDATLLILDEPTSNLDARAEYELFSRFRQLAHGRTTIIVSHRFSTVTMADRIFVLDRGRIVESGTHHDLLAQGGTYAQLFQLQQRSYSIDSNP
ncbi:MAG: multidrug transporter ATPase/permease [Deltaproteobacteria bacterium]|nr:multidrug transporter ATPase/permease [Deltaproteobacteria bacterium]